MGYKPIVPSRKEATPRKRGRPKIASPDVTPAPAAGKSKLHQIQVWLPKAHVDLLTREAELIHVPRANLLGMLLQRRRAGFVFERPAGAPSYAFKPTDFQETVRYTWYMETDLKRMLDEDRMRMGNLTIAAWVIFVLNHYVGWNG
jgi:hypothetical protein